MSRKPRIFVAGMTQHVIQRGNNRTDLFRAPLDYAVFLCAMREASRRFGLSVHAYALMTNHVHLMVTPATCTSLPHTMQAIGRRYVPYFNERYGRTGGLFDGRYRSLAIDDESYWFTCMRYIELNPVRARLVNKPEVYEWSSYRYHAMGDANTLITEHATYHRLGESPEDRRRSWRAICAEAVPETELNEIRNALYTGRLPNGPRLTSAPTSQP